MAAAPKKMFRGALTTTTSTTLATVPTGKTWIVTNIVVTNTANSQITATISLAGILILSAKTVDANGLLAFDMKQVMDPTEVITGGASVGPSGVTCHISGVEV